MDLRYARLRFPIVAIGTSLAACAILQPSAQERASQIEPMLSAAGFSMIVANTPDKLEHLKSLPQLQVQYYADEAGHPKFWMADSEFCQCIYLGDEAAYQKYQQLSIAQRLTERQEQAAAEQEMAAQRMRMGMMRPWRYGPVW